MAKSDGCFQSSSNPDIFICDVEPPKNENGQEIQTFAEYMELKRRKLLRQVHRGITPKSTIFVGVSIFVNGFTVPSASTLRHLIVANGGQYHHYFTIKHTTHMISSAMAPSKWNFLPKSAMVVRPEWILESIKAGFRKSVADYILRSTEVTRPQRSRVVNNQVNHQQQLITNFGNIRRHRQQLPQEKQKQQKQGKEQLADEPVKPTHVENCQFEKIKSKKPIVKAKKRTGKISRTSRQFTYGRKMEEPNTLYIDTVKIDCSKGIADGSLVNQLKDIYLAMIDRLEFCVLRASLRFLERMFFSGTGVHGDWLSMFANLVPWVNEQCERLHQARLILEPERSS